MVKCVWEDSVSLSELSGQKAFSVPCHWAFESQWQGTETTGLLKVVLDLWVSFQLLYHILMKNIFVNLQKQRGKAQQMCGTDCGTPWSYVKSGFCPSSEGRGRHLLRAAAHCGNSVFSGSLKGDEGSHRSRVWLWPHFTDDQVHQCQPTPGFSSTALSHTTSWSCLVTKDWPAAHTSVSSLCKERLMSAGMECGFLTGQLNPKSCIKLYRKYIIQVLVITIVVARKWLAL